jgi:hypothetical protein
MDNSKSSNNYKVKKVEQHLIEFLKSMETNNLFTNIVDKDIFISDYTNKGKNTKETIYHLNMKFQYSLN